MTEETNTRPITENESEDLKQSIETSKAMIPIMQFKLKHAELMRDEGLENNYKEAKLKLESDISNLKSKIMFEEKVVSQYEAILEKGEIAVNDMVEQ